MQETPRLQGAVNLQLPLVCHDDRRMDPDIVARYRTWMRPCGADSRVDADLGQQDSGPVGVPSCSGGGEP